MGVHRNVCRAHGKSQKVPLTSKGKDVVLKFLLKKHLEAALGLFALLFPTALAGSEGLSPPLGALHLVFPCARTERLHRRRPPYRGLSL